DYEVTALTAAGETVASNEKSATVSAANSKVTVSWNVVQGATGYRIYRGTGSGGENLLIGTVVGSATNSFVDTKGGAAVSPLTTVISPPTQATPVATTAVGGSLTGTYYYVVTATTSGGETIAGNAQSVSVTGANNEVTVSWDAVPGAAGYNIYRTTAVTGTPPVPNFAPGSGAVLAGVVKSGTTSSFTDVGGGSVSSPPTAAILPATTLSAPTTSSTGGSLATGTYFYEIAVLTANGETKASNEQSIPVTGPTGEVTLTWTAVPGATGYKIYRGTAAGQENLVVGTVPQLFDANGNPLPGSFTDIGGSETLTPPISNSTRLSVPTQTAPVPATTGGALASGTYYYEITASTQSGETTPSNEQTVIVPGAPQSVTLTPSASAGATLNGTYSYVVTAITAAGETSAINSLGASNEQSIGVTPNNEVTVSWTAVPNATGYRIYRTAAGGASQSEQLLQTVAGGITSFIDTGAPTQSITP
ncbi:MAG: hypothetical protein B7Z74_05985, partial [Deltaproteobacteria bacterium 21-66-5]